MCLPLEQKQPPTKEAQDSITNLQVVAFLQLALIFTRIIVALEFGSLFEFLILFILWSAWADLSYCSCMFYIVFCLYKALLVFVVFATRFQNGKELFGEEPREKAIMVLYFISFFFYIIVSYVCFRAYREFKAIAYGPDDLAPQVNNARYNDEESNRNQNQQQNQYQQNQYQQNQQGNFNAFQGRGVRLG